MPLKQRTSFCLLLKFVFIQEGLLYDKETTLERHAAKKNLSSKEAVLLAPAHVVVGEHMYISDVCE
jgi:hypothetical protein